MGNYFGESIINIVDLLRPPSSVLRPRVGKEGGARGSGIPIYPQKSTQNFPQYIQCNAIQYNNFISSSLLGFSELIYNSI